MADFGTPVASQIAYDPTAALKNVSALLGIQQQQQGLQQQKADVTTAQARAYQAQQQNQELQALHVFVSQAAADPSYKNEDGSPNVQKFQEGAMAIAPTYGQAYIGQATQNFNEGVQNRQALLNLSVEQRKQIGQYFGAVAANPNAGPNDLLDAAEQARTLSDDPAYQRSLDAMLMHSPQTINMTTEQATLARQQYARNVAIAVQAPNAAQSEPGVGTVQSPRGLQYVQTNPQNPGGIRPIGPPIQQGISPQIVNQPGTGAPSIVGPSGQATPITGAPQPGQPQGINWWQPKPGQLAQLQGNVQGVVERTQNGIQAANSSPQAIDALTRINSIMDQGVNTGTAFPALKDMKNLAASLGLDTKTANNASELAKNIARYEAARAGLVGNTDASRQLVEAGSPNYKMDPAAVRAVTQQSLANEISIQMYAKLMSTAPDPQTALQREQQFRSIPNLIQTIELGQMKNQKQVDDFMKRYNLNGADIQKSRQMLQQLGLM